MWDKHNLAALLLALAGAGWSQLLLDAGEGKVPIPNEWQWVFRFAAAVITMALTSLTPYFKLPPKP